MALVIRLCSCYMIVHNIPATKEADAVMCRKRGGTEAERSERLSLVQENGEANALAIASMLRIRKEGFQKVCRTASTHSPLVHNAAVCIPGGTEQLLQAPEPVPHVLGVPASMHAF